MSETPARPTPLPGPLALAGWKERARLPELGLALKAKLDTGARTSALHVSGLRVVREDPEGRHEVEILVTPRRRHPWVVVPVRTRLLGEIEVTDSGGHRERRPLIETLLVLGTLRRRIRLSLTDRSGMLFPLILGRTAIAGALVVDPAARYLLRRSPARAAAADSSAAPDLP